MNMLFFPMLAGHLIADFWLQPTSWVHHKKKNGWKSGYLVLHAGFAAILPVVFTFHLSLWWFVPVIFISHLLIDIFKSKMPDNIAAFLLDQVFHITVLFILAFYATDVSIAGSLTIYWIYISGFVLITNPVGILTGMMLSKIIPAKNERFKLDASAWIGILERILILIFILAGQFAAIGFLIAAKSIFRFNDTREDGNKKAEYFLLGTLVSFTLAIVVGLIVNKIILVVKAGL